jgi:hypothetical protein
MRRFQWNHYRHGIVKTASGLAQFCNAGVKALTHSKGTGMVRYAFKKAAQITPSGSLQQPHSLDGVGRADVAVAPLRNSGC